MPDGSEHTPQGRRTLEDIMGALDGGKAKADDEAGRRRWLREQFAGAALTGLLAAGGFPCPNEHAKAAEAACRYADALLETLEKTGGQS